MHESSRAIISDRLKTLQNQLSGIDTQIEIQKQELKGLEVSRQELINAMKEIAGGLQALGGPLPDWTDDLELVAFWDEVKGG